ncbi:Interferon-induced very large GTPase 1 [Holothuria leucospilota]|uniref:Interferon-induced very large GTPase 1 n=1 Tax=Holothuria leucospilota TaxID=206669 RepID=A0A9Q1BCT1_HOLLE|nr:Interferon-induced very large GTPase 1 [Holothuria leucospilota]
MKSFAVFLFMWHLQFSFGTYFEGCESPQYLQFRRSGIIHCSFYANISAVFWYSSTNIIFNDPIVTLIDSVKGGQGYKSGEFDVTSNGSLIIPDVNTNHGKNFSVATFTSLDDEPSVYVVVVVITGVQSGECDSPQYLEYGGTGIINCRFQTNFYGVFWYNSTDTVFNEPILTYTQSVKGGRAYESGEFDVFPNGSLILREVRLDHEHSYTVAKFTSADEDPTLFAVVVIVIVKSLFEGPVIDKCENNDSICFIQLDGSSEVGCTVYGARPAVSLKLLTLTSYGDRNISFEINLASSNITFTSRVVTSEDFAHSPVLSLLVCKAEFVPGVLQRDESLVLVQNNYRSLSSVPAVVKYAQRDSALELDCTTNEISFLVWKRSLLLNNSYQNLVFATFIEHHVITKNENHFELRENGSLILRHIDLPHEGFYACIYGDGITDGMAKYEVITYVQPFPVHPVVKGCNHQRNCVLEVHRSGILTCSVNGIRPVVKLEWKVSNETHSRSISFFNHTSSVITTSGETFNITLTSSYSVGFVKQMTIECGVSGPDGDIFPVKSGVKLLFLPDLTKQTEYSAFSTIIFAIVTSILFAAVFLLAMVCLRKAYRHHTKTRRQCKARSIKEELSMHQSNPMLQDHKKAYCHHTKTRRQCEASSIEEELSMHQSNSMLQDDVEERDFELPSEPEYSEGEVENVETQTWEEFLEKVGLKDKYPSKLKLRTFLQLGTNDPKSYVYIFWQKLHSLDYRAGILQELVLEDYSMRDFIFCLLHCSDNFLRQDILEKMSACQLAVPIVLQGTTNSKPTFLLWALRRIMKKWKGESDSFAVEEPIVSYPVLNVSVLRIGDVRISKSQLMNTMLSCSQGYSSHTFFLHRGKDFAVPIFSPGSIECVWFLPVWGSKNQIFKEVTAFFNLRGDCTKYPQQTKFVCKAAHLTIALIATSNHNLHKKCISLIRRNSKSTLFISVSDGESRGTASKKVHRPKHKDGCIFANAVQMDILSQVICEEIVNICNIDNSAKTCLESFTTICGEQIRIDEDEEYCKIAKDDVREIFGHEITDDSLDVLNFKENSFPLQSVWKDLVDIDKASLQIEADVQESFEHQIESKRVRKREKRKLQLEKKLSLTMETYLKIMKRAKSNPPLLQYIFGFMQEKIYHMVNENTKNDLNDAAKLEKEIFQIRGHKMAKGNVYDITDKSDERCNSEVGNDSSYRVKVDKCRELYRNCLAKNLGAEHFLRELGQLYEAFVDLQGEVPPPTEALDTSIVTLLPSLAAQLVTEMQSFEIMDGDTGCVPLTWVTSVLDILRKELNNPKVLVLSVIGVQSSGKSTLLNSMFGVSFPVRAGRCTRGLFFQLLKLSDELSEELGFNYLVVVDSEGIRSIEHDSQRFDNELVTLALSISNVTIFNIAGENIGPDMTGILQIAAHALMRMKEVDLACHCRIVQQRVSDLTASDRNKASTKKIKDTLDEATRFAAEEEGLEGRYQQFSDVVDLQVDDDVQYVPCLWSGGMAPPNHLYSELVSKFKANLFEEIKKGIISPDLTLSTFTERVRDVWEAIKGEDFIFNFHDSVKAVDFNKLCLDYNEWIARMRHCVQAEINRVLFLVHSDTNKECLYPDLKTLKDMIEIEIKKQQRKLTKCVEDYITKHPRKITMLRYKQEFLHDVSVVLRETESYSLDKITDEYEIAKIGLNLPRFQNKSRQLLTLETKVEAKKVTGNMGILTNYNFDAIWQTMIGKLKKEHNITHVTMTHSSLKNICEKLLLKITRDMAVGSEIQALLSLEGGITNHVSLNDCSKYISGKHVKSWLRHETSSQLEMKGSITVENDRQPNERETTHVLVEEMSPLFKVVMIPYLQSDCAVPNTRGTFQKFSASNARKGENIPNVQEKECMEEKRQQAIMYLQNILRNNLCLLLAQSKAFDANIFQLMLRKTLKELSTKDDNYNFKLPYSLIAKGLLFFCGQSLNIFCKFGDNEIEHYLDFRRSVFERCFHCFLNHEDQDHVAVDFILYYTEKILRDKIATFREKIRNNVDYRQYTERVHVPWDLLYFLNTDLPTRRMFDHIIFNFSLQQIIDLYVERKKQECNEKISADVVKLTVCYINDLINNIGNLQSDATNWKDWCQSLGKYLECSFIPSAGDIFQVTDVSTVARMFQSQLDFTKYLEVYAGCEDFDYSSFKNAAGLSYVCNEVCPMCGAWCDNILESHTVHRSSLHRPRGLNGEKYIHKTNSKHHFQSNYGEFDRYVLEDCYISIRSETATFHYKGQTLLCKDFKDLFPNWDIHPVKNAEEGKLYWQRYFATYSEGVASYLPRSWNSITHNDALQSLIRAKFAFLN